MSETVHNVTTLPNPTTSLLKKIAKRTLLAAVAVGVGAAIYSKVNGPGEETDTQTTQD